MNSHCILTAPAAPYVAVSGLFFESETNRRRLMESKIITRLGTLAPQGLNRIDDYNFRH